jgi:hypothetical protein
VASGLHHAEVAWSVWIASRLSPETTQRICAPVGLDDVSRAGAQVAPKVLASWRARAAVEAPSPMRTHPRELTVLLLAAPVQERSGRSPTRWWGC